MIDIQTIYYLSGRFTFLYISLLGSTYLVHIKEFYDYGYYGW